MTRLQLLQRLSWVLLAAMAGVAVLEVVAPWA